MKWKPIEEAPDHRKQILVGFQGQFKWYSYVANAHGIDTGNHMAFAKPTHWTEITVPEVIAS